METPTKIVKYVKEEIDMFEDGQPVTTYTEITYVLKSMIQLTEKEFNKRTKK